MRRYGAFILLLVLAAPAIAAEPPPTDESPSIPWYRRVFLGERTKPAPPKPPVTAAKPPSRESIARSLAEENKLYTQRLLAISKIRQMADEQGDEAMLKKADELEDRAAKVYADRTAKLSSAEDKAALERGRESAPGTAERPATRRRTPRGDER